MWLSKVELKNFKTYRQQQFHFPKPIEDKNIILVGGVNGFGKTTLLEAIYVGLYGDEAIKHKALDRAGLKAKSYGHFLETAFYSGALREGQDKMEVTVEFVHDDDSVFSITRKWFFSGSGKYSSDRLIIKQRNKNGDWNIKQSDDLPDLLYKYATPPWLAPFFFFDGEKITELADADREGWIKSGLENLMGVVLIRDLRQQLTQYIDKKNRVSGGVDEKKIETLKQELEIKKIKLAKLLEDIENKELLLAQNRENYDSLMTRLTTLARGSSARTVAEVAEAMSRAKQEGEFAWKHLRELSFGRLALQLIRHDLYDSLEKTLASETALAAWEQGKEQLQPRWEQFRHTFFKSEWLSVISQLPGARESLEKTLEGAWDSLFNPRPLNCATSIWHDYLQGLERKKIPEFRQKVRLSINELRNVLDRHTNADKEIHRLQNELNQLEGTGDNGEKIQQLKDEIDRCNTSKSETDRELGKLINEQRALDADISSLTATYEREHKRLAEGHSERKAAREASRIVDAIDQLLPKLFEIKLKEFSNRATQIFRSLHQKDQVYEIKITNEGKTQIFSKEGTEITLSRSSGESQLFVMALVGALAEVTSYSVPLIVDTPLARLSEKHCKNLLNYWISDKNRQVILLAQDKELGQNEYLDIKPYIAKTYLIEHIQGSHGIGKSEAIPDIYFEKTS